MRKRKVKRRKNLGAGVAIARPVEANICRSTEE